MLFFVILNRKHDDLTFYFPELRDSVCVAYLREAQFFTAPFSRAGIGNNSVPLRLYFEGSISYEN